MARNIKIADLDKVLAAFGFGATGTWTVGARGSVYASREESSDRVCLCRVVDAGPVEVNAAMTKWFRMLWALWGSGVEKANTPLLADLSQHQVWLDG